MTAAQPNLVGVDRPVHIAWEVGTRRPSRRTECSEVTEWWISPNEARRHRDVAVVLLCAGCVSAHNTTHRKGDRL